MSIFDLSGRTALVTGGNGGIGLAIAKALAAAGAAVAIVGRDPAKNERAVAAIVESGGKACAQVVDVTDEADVRRGVETLHRDLGPIDILVNNAGTNDRKLPQQYSLAEWNDLLAVNLTSAFIVSQALYPIMAGAGRGRIINVGSMLSIFGGGQSAPYAAAKAGVVQLTKSLAIAWATDGITANAILPGWIDTDLTQQARQQIPDLNERVVARTPMKRWGRPGDIAGAAVFLASDAAAFVTGIALPVDGGYSAN